MADERIALHDSVKLRRSISGAPEGAAAVVVDVLGSGEVLVEVFNDVDETLGVFAANVRDLELR